MTEFDNTNRGVLFKNERKETDKHADYTGTLNVGGVDHYMDAWVKESKAGKKFFSVSIKKKLAKDAPRETGVELEDEVPF